MRQRPHEAGRRFRYRAFFGLYPHFGVAPGTAPQVRPTVFLSRVPALFTYCRILAEHAEAAHILPRSAPGLPGNEAGIAENGFGRGGWDPGNTERRESTIGSLSFLLGGEPD